jgi:TP901 family phage tail tape measure protein
MSDAVIGALRGVLVLDTSDWSPAIGRARGDLTGLRGALELVARTMDEVARRARAVGTGLTVGLSAPLAALAATSAKTASGFEKSMKNVEAALKGVTGKELKELALAARELGPKVGKGATETADGIEALGLAGVSTADILGGALKASLDLAAAGAVQLAPATSLVTDVMGQFKKTAADLPVIVQNVVGALDSSKFGFIDFQQAVAQGGGIAKEAGISFADFATAISATSTQFSSGSDAGTSFKTYIQSLVPVSKDAEFAMNQLGLEFFDVRTKRMKPLVEQADMLRKALGNLNDKSKSDALKTIFGADAARTAIGLMNQGREGIEKLQREIAGGDVGAKIAKRLEGEAAATTRIANAWESVRIAIGEAGLLELMTRVKAAFAGVLESIAGASPAVLKVGVVFGAVAAALGPLALVLGSVAGLIIGHVVRGFGTLGRIAALIISPISALASEFSALVLRFGLFRGLAAIGRLLLGLGGPITWAIAAVISLKDGIAAGLQAVSTIAEQTLGGRLGDLLNQLGALFTSVVNGPIGGALSKLGALIGVVLDVLNTFAAVVIEAVGQELVTVMAVAIEAVSGVIAVVQQVVTAVAALLTGDFASAWSAAAAAVDAACQTIVNIVTAIFPEATIAIQAMYEAAKAFLVDGFASIGALFVGIVQGAVSAVGEAFPGVVSAAKSVYEGVKGWLVDKFGGLMTWIGNAAKWIGDKYAALKERLGLGASAAGDSSEAPAAPKPVVAPPTPAGTRNVSFEQPKAAKKVREKKGRNTEYDGQNREQLREQIALEAARLRGDHAAVRLIQDRLDMSRQIEAYQRTGLTLDQARAAAQRDMKEIAAARLDAQGQEMARQELGHQLDVARMRNEHGLVEALEREHEIKERIARFRADGLSTAEAELRSARQQLEIDEARAQIRREWFERDARSRAIRMAELRGDSEEGIRALKREEDIARRIEDLRNADKAMSAGAARKQAETEWSEEDKARQTGVFRDTFKEGVRAALDGDLKGWFKNWWRDRVAKGMEEALNSLADLIAGLFSDLRSGSSSGALDTIGKAIGSVLGGESSRPSSAEQSAAAFSLPGFATGGSFKVGGMSGVDRNVVAFRATKGEMVDIRRPGNDNGAGGSTTVHQTIQFSGAVDLATRSEVYRVADAARQSAVRAIREADRRRG